MLEVIDRFSDGPDDGAGRRVRKRAVSRRMVDMAERVHAGAKNRWQGSHDEDDHQDIPVERRGHRCIMVSGRRTEERVTPF